MKKVTQMGDFFHFVEARGIEPRSESVYERESTARSQRYCLRQDARNADETIPARSRMLSATDGRPRTELTDDSASSRAVGADRERTSR
jgi:hypothetical protein